jgi:hypothetical protein
MDDDFTVTAMADDLWTIDEGMVRCFLVAGSERAVLIDSCVNKDEALAEVRHDGVTLLY